VFASLIVSGGSGTSPPAWSSARTEIPAAEQPVGAHADGPPLPAGVASSKVVVDGLAVPVSSAGPAESAAAVVFVHGNPGSRRDWDDLLSRVAPFSRVLALDMPGFGRADKPGDFTYTVEGYGRFLEAALKELEVQRAHLVLHDFGGPWGLEWAARDPNRPASAVLINTGVLLDFSCDAQSPATVRG
jgi:pimeloyl-ACP methyl ester carboxylesterase